MALDCSCLLLLEVDCNGLVWIDRAGEAFLIALDSCRIPIDEY